MRKQTVSDLLLVEAAARRRRRSNPVDRDSDRWKRIRSGCGYAAGYLDLDSHADGVWQMVESFLSPTSGAGVDPPFPTPAAAGKAAR